MKKLVLILLLLPLIADAQSWRRYRRELVFGFGSSNALTDLGGADRIGSHFLRDYEFRANRAVISGGYRYRIDRHHSYRLDLSVGMLYMSDKLTKEYFRNARNITVRTPVVEISGRYEYFINKDKDGSRYHVRRSKGLNRFHLHTYGFVGVGVTYYQPQGLYKDGTWINLRPLSTEGQGLPGGPKKYVPVTVCFPVGFGFKHSFTRLTAIGFEFGKRYTLSNYIDDTGSNYYDNALILASKGDKAAYFADPRVGEKMSAGEVRGKKDKDTYMFIQLSLTHKIAPKRTKAKF